MDLVLGIVFNQPVHYIEPMSGVYNKDKSVIYSETSNGYWVKYEYDNNGKVIYYEDADGLLGLSMNMMIKEIKIYHEESDGYIIDNR